MVNTIINDRNITIVYLFFFYPINNNYITDVFANSDGI